MRFWTGFKGAQALFPILSIFAICCPVRLQLLQGAMNRRTGRIGFLHQGFAFARGVKAPVSKARGASRPKLALLCPS
jgi:hypothetical protein